MWHKSLDPHLAEQLNEPIDAPPAPIVDMHMHTADVEATRVYVEAARAYGVTHAVALTHESPAGVEPLREAFGGFFTFCGHLDMRGMADGAAWSAGQVRRVERLAEAGFRFLKLKVAPADRTPPAWWIDDERLEPVLGAAADAGLVLQIHIAHPDCWWGKHFHARDVGEKLSYFDQVERVLARHPSLRVLGVHMGGHPEDLGHLDRLLAAYPNYHLDTSATKWVVRELSARREAARAFFARWPDRICFGSDLVVQRSAPPSYYTSRFHVQRTMWEADGEHLSMIRDPDSAGAPVIRALALPDATLDRLYRANALALLGPGAG